MNRDFRKPGTPPNREALPSPGEAALAGAAIAIGIILLGIQLWALTVALELYLAGEGEGIWGLAILSGVVFLGGLVALWLLRDRRVVGR